MHNDNALIEACLRQWFREPDANTSTDNDYQSLISHLNNHAQVLSVDSGETIFRQGDVGDSMFIVLQGRLQVAVNYGSGRLVPVTEVGRNETVGEMALFTDQLRSATVSALRDSRLLQISREQFDYIAQVSPVFVLYISRQVISRLSQSMMGHSQGRPKANRLVIVPSHPDIAIDTFSSLLGEALRKHGSVLEFDEAVYAAHAPEHKVDNLLEPDEYLAFSNWLEEKENRFDFMLMRVDGTDTDWAQACIGLGDRVLLLADKNSPESDNVIFNNAIRKSRTHLDLIILKNNVSETISSALSRARQIDGMHNICLSNNLDVQRLARFYSKKSVGLVLAGGGAKGFAHIGAIKAFREHNIPIDSVGGTSVGALISAFVAMGFDIDEMLAVAREGFIEKKPLGDYTLPIVAVLRGTRLNKVVQSYSNVESIEDLWLNFFCISANLTSNETMIHDRGSLWQALRASISLPGIVPPVVNDGQLLVDGGLVNNLPVDVMSSTDVGKIIAIDLQGESRQFSVDSSMVSPSQTLVRPVFKRNKTTEGSRPGLFDIMMKASLISSAQQTNKNRVAADLFLNPPIENYGLLEFKALDDIVEIGYQHTCRQLEASDFQDTL